MLPTVCKAIQHEIQTMPPPMPNWTIDEHDRLVSKMFRVAWCTHGLPPTLLPRKPWVTQDILGSVCSTCCVCVAAHGIEPIFHNHTQNRTSATQQQHHHTTATPQRYRNAPSQPRSQPTAQSASAPPPDTTNRIITYINQPTNAIASALCCCQC